jgi:hypothetical protein
MSATGGSDKAALAQQVSAVVKAGHPLAYCFPCLARMLELSENRIRETAELLVALRRFHVEPRTCHRCERTDDMIVVKE